MQNKQRVPKRCPTCKEWFIPSRKHQIFDNERCAARARYERRKEKVNRALALMMEAQ